MTFRIRRLLTQLVGSSFFVPLLFLCFYRRIFSGTQVFFHDSADGFSAFKFANLIPQYWNWFEMGGIPFWMDMGWFRLQDPMTWPILLLAKALPIGQYAAFHVFLLLQVSLLGVLISAFLKEMGIRTLERQISTAIALFGSLGSSIFAQWGMWGTLYGFLICAYFLLRLAKTRKIINLTFLSLALIQNSLTYHSLLGLPIMALACILCLLLFKAESLRLMKFLWSKRVLLVAHLFAISLAYGASLLAPRHEGLLPILRSMNYATEVSISGVNLNSDLDHGKSLFNSRSLRSISNDCNKSERCTEYFVKYLQTFYSNQTYLAELPGFVTLIGLFLLFMSLLFSKTTKLIPIFLSLTLFAFFLSLGSGTPLWGGIQRLFPILGFVRHTHFYLSFFTFGMICLISLSLSKVRDSFRNTKMRLAISAMLTITIVWELLDYQKLFFKEIQIDLPPHQRAALDKPLPTSFRSRTLRIRERKLNPRSSVGTAYGFPTAMENTQAKDQILGNSLHPVRFFGYPTPFILEEYLRARLYFSENLDAFKRVFGVDPFPIFMLYPQDRLITEAKDRMSISLALNRGRLLVDESALSLLTFANAGTDPLAFPEGQDIHLKGDDLNLNTTASRSAVAYLSVPFEQISKILIDEREVNFYRANLFGLAFKVPGGTHHIKILPKQLNKYMIFTLFYGAYGWIAMLYLVPYSIRVLRRFNFKLFFLHPTNLTE